MQRGIQMKLSKSSQTKLKNQFTKGYELTEVLEDGTVFYYENEEHKTTLEKRKARKEAAREAKRAARTGAREAKRAAKEAASEAKRAAKRG